MKKNVLVNGRVMTTNVESNEIVTMNELKLSPERHALYAKKITSKIFEVVPVIDALVLRAELDDNYNVSLCGEVFKTKGSNTPNARALMEFCKDFDNENVVDIQLSEWDEKNKTIKPTSIVKCNNKNQKVLYAETYSHTSVIFSMIEKDLKEEYKRVNSKNKSNAVNISDKDISALKDKLIDEISNLGLVISEGKAHVNNGKHTGIVLNPLKWSPSNMRGQSIYMTRINETSSFNVLNELSGHALEEAILGKKTIAKSIKTSARLGILSAPAIPMAKSANDKFSYVIVLDEIVGAYDYDEETNDKLKEVGIDIDNNISDGAAQHSVEYIAYSFEQMGRKMSLSQALYFAVQTRTNVFFTKTFGEAKTQFNMQYRLKQLINKYGEDKVLRVKAGQDVSGVDINDYKVIIIGNEECIASIIDYNGGKLLKDISLQTMIQGNVDTYLLDIAKASESKTSEQMLIKFLVANLERTIEVVNNLLVKELNDRFEEMVEGEVDPQNCSLAQFILRYAENGCFNTVALESLIKEQLKFNEAMVKKSRLSVDSLFQRALFDDSYFLTNGKINGLLGRNKWTNRLECYSLDVELRYADEINAIDNNPALTDEEKDKAKSELLTGVAFKYPSSSSDENAIVTYVTRKQISDRIDELKASKAIRGIEAKVLKDDFLNTSYGVTKIGADNTLKHKLAGMDTDYDGIVVVFEKDLVQILLDKYVDNDGLVNILVRK